MHKYDTYIVKVRRVAGVPRARMQGYIKEAVACWSGQYEPQTLANGDLGDPLGPPCPLMDKGAVKVFPVARHKDLLLLPSCQKGERNAG